MMLVLIEYTGKFNVVCAREEQLHTRNMAITKTGNRMAFPGQDKKLLAKDFLKY